VRSGRLKKIRDIICVVSCAPLRHSAYHNFDGLRSGGGLVADVAVGRGLCGVGARRRGGSLTGFRETNGNLFVLWKFVQIVYVKIVKNMCLVGADRSYEGCKKYNLRRGGIPTGICERKSEGEEFVVKKSGIKGH